jgi:hypothetical protein
MGLRNSNPNTSGEWKWRVVEVIEQGFKETLATRLTLNVPQKIPHQKLRDTSDRQLSASMETEEGFF